MRDKTRIYTRSQNLTALFSLGALLLLSVEVGVKVIPKAVARIVEPNLLVQLVNLFDIRFFKRKGNVEVLGDSLWRLGLGNHRTTVGNSPSWNSPVSSHNVDGQW